MSLLQRFFVAIFPKAWAESMEAESRLWVARCKHCGFEQSIWEMGGIRWGARGNPARYCRCPKCHEPTWQAITKRDPAGKQA